MQTAILIFLIINFIFNCCFIGLFGVVLNAKMKEKNQMLKNNKR